MKYNIIFLSTLQILKLILEGTLTTSVLLKQVTRKTCRSACSSNIAAGRNVRQQKGTTSNAKCSKTGNIGR
jgi:hypothetical protein